MSRYQRSATVVRVASRLPWLHVATAACLAVTAVETRAQNDWQFPDPYFGILEFESSRRPAEERPRRPEISPAPRPMTSPRPRRLRARRRHVQPLQR